MKKLLFAVVAFFAMVNVACAKDDVMLASGSLFGLNQGEQKVYVAFDYSAATIEGKKPADFLKEKGEEWVNNYSNELEKAEAFFCAEITKRSKTMKIVNSEAEADYVMTVRIGNFHYGSSGLSVVIGFGAGDAHLSANVDITKDGTKVAQIVADGVPGDGYGNEVRRNYCYIGLAKNIAKLVKKAKK